MTAFPFCLFGVEIASLPWRRRAPISVGPLQKANWLGRVLCVHITLLDLLWRMAVCLMARQCIRNLVWRSAPAMDRSKCADLSAKDAISKSWTHPQFVTSAKSLIKDCGAEETWVPMAGRLQPCGNRCATTKIEGPF